ncbi:two component transcriptional regulator, winged helix family [Ancylobacter novellus DSM 506]|uniref:Two component transcriptional regulator, winged helix family n=1 Tax=Ancylobacter novellus (strain ATCC 8093 / DSM 506 / JCM 20403 / CCM 1077 / IAM 12100 / NBRC 12443 / NCIMB 10456) TaxID=639283 RepID=D7A807_ANCN5|nr:response regulator transcription factor [Ancylobacter novellus]ADH90465.1 two component transcriptional regulator, winged helix family [Ancylobacter novellus DSM 506]
MRLLLVEDSPRLRELVGETIRGAGWRFDAVGSASEADAALASTRYDLILLDLGLPDGDGLDLLRDLRARRDTTPVLVLTARGAVDERIAGLDAGADDYLAKPFNNGELLARARALLRRAPLSSHPVLEAGALRYDPATHEVRCGDEVLALAPRERATLEILMRNVGRVTPKRGLEEKLSEFDGEMSPNAIEVMLSRLRRKLAPYETGTAIETVRGVGYLLRETD